MSKVNKPATCVLIDATPLAEKNMSGIGHVTLETVRHLAAIEGLDVKLMVPYDRLDLVKKRNIENVGYATIPLPLRIFNLLLKYRMLPPIELLFGRAVYIYPNFRRYTQLRFSSITYFHDMCFAAHPDYVQPKNRHFLNSNVHRWASKSTKLVTVSNHAKGEINKYLPSTGDKVTVIHNGVDTGVYRPADPRDISKYKKKYNIKGKYLLYLGNIEPRKNIMKLLEAYEAIPSNVRRNYSLVLIGGDGWLNQEVLSRVSNLQQRGFSVVRPDVYVPDHALPSLLSGATALVHPAVYEGFGVSVLQAMACGTPVVCGSNSSLKEIGGSSAMYVDVNSASSLAQGIIRVVSSASIRRNLARKGLERSGRFTWDRAANRLNQLIQEVNNG